MRVHFLTSIDAPERRVRETPFRCVEAIAEINKCCRVLPLRAPFMKYHLTTVGVPRPLIEGEHTSEFANIIDFPKP